MVEIHAPECKSIVIQLTHTSLKLVVVAAFICGLLNDAVRSSLYRVERYVNNYWTGKEVKGSDSDLVWGTVPAFAQVSNGRAAHFV
jgi:hypothetical protein